MSILGYIVLAPFALFLVCVLAISAFVWLLDVGN